MWILLLASLAAAADPIVDGLQAELDRTMAELALPDAPGIHHVGLQHLERRWIAASATRGALLTSSEDEARSLGVEVRVGDTTFDNASFQYRWHDTGFDRVEMGLEATPATARHEAWLTLDEAFKAAVATYARKLAERRRQGERPHPAAFESRDPVVADTRSAAPPWPTRGELEAHARAVSAVTAAHGWIEGRFEVAVSTTDRTVLDSTGTRVSTSHPIARAELVLGTRAADGESAQQRRVWKARTWAELPGVAEMAAEAEAMAGHLEAWREAAPETEPWVGPVLLAGRASSMAFDTLLIQRLSGTPPMEEAMGRFFLSTEEEDQDPLALKRRVLPDTFEIEDDPDPSEVCGFTHDFEGVPAQPLTLVKKGVVRDLLMSRTPGRQLGVSNGRARGQLGRQLRGQSSCTTIQARRPLASKKLLKKALTLAAEVDLDHVLLIRDFGELSALVFNREETALPPPSWIVKVYADGREEPVRGLDFADLDRRSLRDIAAAGPASTWHSSHGPSRRLTTPSILIEELELAPKDPADRFEPPLEPPVATR